MPTLEQPTTLPVLPSTVWHETLRRMAEVHYYNEWVYNLLKPYVGRRVVEVGCGIGNMSYYFLGADLLLSFDLLPESVEHVTARYPDASNLIVTQGDVCDRSFIAEAASHSFDTVVSINMLEHVEEHQIALSNMYQLIADDGYLLLFVPAGRYLYGTLDRALGHYRRYDKAGLARVVRAAGFNIVKLHYVNALGVVGWWVNSCLLRRHLLPKKQLHVFNVLAMPLQKLESRIVPPIGQSLVCIARKSAHSSTAGVRRP